MANSKRHVAPRDKFDLIRLFRQAVEETGLDAPADVIADGEIHRFPTNGKLNDDAGWYILFEAPPFAKFGCWRSNVKSTWSPNRQQGLTPGNHVLHCEQIKRAEQLRMQEEARYVAGRVEAMRRLAASKPVESHPYLTAKGVAARSITAEGGQLLVPLFDSEGNVRGVQTITASGQKRFMRGAQVHGNYHLIGKVVMVIVVCEGYATGLTIHHCTGLPVAVAFCANNVEPVARSLRCTHPNALIIIAADDDWGTEGNPGRTAAKAAALTVGGVVVLPIFPRNRPPGATDFNDLQRLAGNAAVVACFEHIQEV